VVLNEFDDLMPHVIKVTKTVRNDYGKQVIGTDPPRQYKCLIDDSTTTVRDVSGEEVTVALTAYVWAVPIDSLDGNPVDIEDTEIVEIITPRPETRTLTGIERHYYSDRGIGYLHNLTLRFS
jgi:hypothetical protein